MGLFYINVYSRWLFHISAKPSHIFAFQLSRLLESLLENKYTDWFALNNASNPGSAFVHELSLYGEYVALVTGPFGNLPSDFNTLVDFMARERAVQAKELRDIKPALALAVRRRAWVRRIGLLTTCGWAQFTKTFIVVLYRYNCANRVRNQVKIL